MPENLLKPRPCPGVRSAVEVHIAGRADFERAAFGKDGVAMTLFLSDLKQILKPDQLIETGSDFDLLAKDPAVNARKPSAFIYPESQEQVQALIRLASKNKIRLWVYSTGKNWGYLNTSGSDNSVVLLLNRMDKIVFVDPELAYAILEPGVTYEKLNRFLTENNIPLWTDSPGGPPTGSVIGNALDRGVGVTKYGDHFAHLCGLEVVLADGTILRTGVASTNGEKGAAHLYKWGVGPYIEGLFGQSNFGIVTQAGIWLMRKPQDYALFSLNIKDDDRLAECMDSIRELMLDGVLHETGRFSNDVAMLTLLTQAIEEGYSSKQVLSQAELDSLKKKYELPGWTGTFSVYGQGAMVRAASRIALKRLKDSNSCARISCFSQKRAQRLLKLIDVVKTLKHPVFHKLIDKFVRKWIGSSLALVNLFPSLNDLHQGKPVETVVRRGYFRHNKRRPERDIHIGRDDIGVLWSVPVLPFKGAEIVAFGKKCEGLFRKFKFDFYMTTMIFNARSVCPLMVILYDRLDEEACHRAERLYLDILDLSHEHGYQHFRAGINGWKKLFQHCPEIKSLNQKLKAALDPQGVFAPGRYGID